MKIESIINFYNLYFKDINMTIEKHKEIAEKNIKKCFNCLKFRPEELVMIDFYYGIYSEPKKLNEFCNLLGYDSEEINEMIGRIIRKLKHPLFKNECIAILSDIPGFDGNDTQKDDNMSKLIFSNPVKNALEKANIKKVEDLLNLDDYQIRAMTNSRYTFVKIKNIIYKLKNN